MAVISIVITASEEEIVKGIPKTISISTNLSATIFYTLDGSTPTLFSTIYTGPIFLPYDKLSITLSVLASNGVDSSPIVTDVYTTNMVEGTNVRLSHSGTSAAAESNIPDLYPFGTPSIQPNAPFTNPADAGITVDNPALPEISNGFDSDGNPTALTNAPYNLENYSIVYSTTNSQGQTGLGIGNLPADVDVIVPPAPAESTDQTSNLFDPRALVIFQDSTTENPNDPPYINRMNFSLENPERARDGNNFYSSGLDAPPVNGTFLRSHYNPRTNMITYYYLDTWTNRWIISTTPYVPNGSWDGNLSGMALSKEKGAGFVFEWIPFARRVLF